MPTNGTSGWVDYNMNYNNSSGPTNTFIGYSDTLRTYSDFIRQLRIAWDSMEFKPPQRKPKIGEQLMMFEL